jgi:hypothetical protein
MGKGRSNYIYTAPRFNGREDDVVVADENKYIVSSLLDKTRSWSQQIEYRFRVELKGS